MTNVKFYFIINKILTVRVKCLELYYRYKLYISDIMPLFQNTTMGCVSYTSSSNHVVKNIRAARKIEFL